MPDKISLGRAVGRNVRGIAGVLVGEGEFRFDTIANFTHNFFKPFAVTFDFMDMHLYTVHQLLTHTAGMGNYPQAPEFVRGLREWHTTAETMDGVMTIIRNTETQPAFVPGTRHVYSNSGFFVLGAIVAQVSGEPYHDYIRRRVLAPAGMTRSDLYTRPQVLANRDIARPYWTQPSGPRVDFTTTEYFGFVGGPAQGIYSTVRDLLEFVGALREGRLLNPAFTELFTNGKAPLLPTDRPITPAQSRFYGYGFRDAIVGDQRVFGHSGTGNGAATNLDIFPDLDWVAVVVSNYDTSVEPIVLKERELITQLGRQYSSRTS